MLNLQPIPQLTVYSMELVKSLSAGQQYDYESGNPVDHSSLMHDAAQHIQEIDAKLVSQLKSAHRQSRQQAFDEVIELCKTNHYSSSVIEKLLIKIAREKLTKT